MNSLEPSAAAVRTDRLVKRYERQTALDGVDLMVPEGAVYLLAGTNGAGKSTLLRTLLNLERPDAGSATVLGRDSFGEGPQVRANTGYVPETGEATYRWMRAGRFLTHLAGFYPNWDARYAAQLVGLLDVRTESRLGSLSKGQARRVQIVAALAHRPPLLLLDELTDGLDPLAREEVLGLLASHLAETGASVLLSTHLVAEVETLVDHVGVLSSGRMIAQAPARIIAERLQRYELDAPDGWQPPASLAPSIVRRETGLGRSLKLVAIGNPSDVVGSIAAAGAAVRGASRLSLAEAVLILLQSETNHAFV
jgi:ABC-2 type transport system ATP-binding protein